MNNRIDLTPETIAAARVAEKYYLIGKPDLVAAKHHATLAELCRQLRAEAVMMFDLLDDMEPGDRRRVAELLALWPEDSTGG